MAPGPYRPHVADELRLVVGTRAISGWTGVRVTTGVERCPPDFEIEMTDLTAGMTAMGVVNPGEPCQVYAGDDLLITGYVDSVAPSLAVARHEIRIAGRGKCQDLVDCSAKSPGSQISGATTLGIAQKLAKPYGIAVGGERGVAIPKFPLIIPESAWDVIERICRYAALLAYELPDGSLTLAKVGDAMAASGIVEGENVQQASLHDRMDQRYSEYEAFKVSIDPLGGDNAENVIQTVRDQGVPRYRNFYLVAEAGVGLGFGVTRARALWESARRAGRSRQVRVTVDGWRDFAGTLWTPNTLVEIALPSFKIEAAKWALVEVTFNRSDDAGTTAELTLMPREALMPEPIVLLPLYNDIPGGATPELPR